MPTIISTGGFRLKVFGPPREHPPPHVHVARRGAGVVVIRLGHGDDPCRVWKVYGDMTSAEIMEAYRLVVVHETELRNAWERIHDSAPTD